MNTVWDWTILTIVLGLVSTFEICIIGSIIGKILESKLRTHYELEMQYYDKVMDRFEKTVDKFSESIIELIKLDKNTKSNNIYDFRKKEFDND